MVVQIGHLSLGGGLVQQLSHREATGTETDSVGRGTCPPRHCGVPIPARMEAEAGPVGVRSTWNSPLASQAGPVLAATQ